MEIRNREEKDRFYSRKWGVFNHYLWNVQNDPSMPNSKGLQTDWDTLVNEFDTDRLARELHRMGAGYYTITVMQGKKYMIAPNAAFDRIAGTKPGEACSTRDLIADLYDSLAPYDIDLFLYFTGDGPYQNPPEGARFGFTEPRTVGVTRPFVENWASVLEEYAVRYGDKIKGWWIDGCYRENFGYTDDLLEVYYKACKKGNPNALVALNNGVVEGDIAQGYTYEDFLCGERNDFDRLPSRRFYGDAQAHMLIPLGTIENLESVRAAQDPVCNAGWGCFGIKRDREYLVDYVRRFNAAGGVLSIDVGVYRDGTFDLEQAAVLRYLGENL